MRTLVVITFVQTLATIHVSATGLPAGHPRNYAAARTASPIEIDGDIYKKSWENAPWSEDFVEIRGDDAPEASKPTADTRTRVKMLWDDDFLYIAAEMSAKNWPITAEFTKRNEPIFQKDSDIEVFLDTDGSNANYKELEVNAKNTVWNLLIDRVYSVNPGFDHEHSGRIAKPGEPLYWDVKGQKTASKMFGKIGQKQPDGKWTCEMALSHKDSLDRTGGIAPALGKFWRINFSRVEKKGDVNWVWSPQMLWSPKDGKYTGQVNMHAPDAWGYVVFVAAGAPAGTIKDWVDPNWNTKAAAHQLYYAETYAAKPEGGGKLLSPEVLQQKNWVSASLFKDLTADVTQASDGSWKANVQDADGCVSTIQKDNLHTFQCEARIFGVPMSPASTVVLGIGSIGVLGAVAAYFVMRQKAKPSGVRD